MKQKRCAELQMFHSTPQTYQTIPLMVVSHLTTTSNGHARPIQTFSNRLITFKSNRNGWFEFELNLEALQVPNVTGHISGLYSNKWTLSQV